MAAQRRLGGAGPGLPPPDRAVLRAADNEGAVGREARLEGDVAVVLVAGERVQQGAVVRVEQSHL